MKAISGVAILLSLQAAGEVVARTLGLPLPGPVIGMLLLLFLLGASAVRERVSTVAEFFLAHLSLLFVPVGVGVMSHIDFVTRFGWQMLLTLVVSTWIGLGVTALCLRRPKANREELND